MKVVAPVAVSQIRTVFSDPLEAEAICVPSGDQARVTTCSPFGTKMLPLAEAMRVPSGDHATALTKLVCLRVSRVAPLTAFQIRTVPSSLAEATRALSGDHAREEIVPVCPLPYTMGLPSAASQICTSLPSPPEATREPSGDHATACTGAP